MAPSSSPASAREAGAWYHRPLLVLLVLAVFGQLLGHEFLRWDDDIHITHTAQLRPPSAEGLLRFWAEPFKGLYTPLAYSYWLLLTSLSAGGQAAPGAPLAPLWFAAGQLVLHGAAVLLVHALLLRLVRTASGALLGAALFAVHPLQVEAVAWMSEARGLLSGVFSLAALVLVLDWRDRGGKLRWGGATLCLILGLCAKPSAVAVPPIALLLLLVRGRAPLVALRSTLPWFVLAAAFAWVSAQLQADAEQVASASPVERCAVALDSLGYYAVKLFCPLGLAPDHARTPEFVIQGGWRQGYGLAGAALVLLAVWGWRGRRAGLWAPPALGAAALAPVLGLIPFDHQLISTVADRYAYLAMLGAAYAAARLVESGRGGSPRARSVAGAAAIAGLALLAGRQAGHWHDTRSLFAHNLRVQPRSVLSLTQLGIAAEADFDPLTAQEQYRRALELDPGHAKAWTNLGNVAFALGDLEGARSAYERSLELRPKGKVARRNVRRLDALVADWEAVLAAERAAAEDGDPRALRRRGAALHELGRTAEAIEDYERALAARPDWTAAELELAWILAATLEHADPERALALVEGASSARAGWVRAMALWARGPEHRQAVLREASEAARAALNAGDPELERRIRGWMRGVELGRRGPGLRR